MPGQGVRILAAALLHFCMLAFPRSSQAQSSVTTRLAILEAEARGATASARDLTILRSGARQRDGETVRIAVRAMGRIERPALIPDILLRLTHSLPEVRAEAANAAAQAAQGLKTVRTPPAGVTIDSIQAALVARLTIEADATVRAVLYEAIARLPYRAASEIERAEAALIDQAVTRAVTVNDRLGLARGFEALLRLHIEIRPMSTRVNALLRSWVEATAARIGGDAPRDARVRRLSLEALINAKALDDELIDKAILDPDAQVRRLAMRAVAVSNAGLGSVPNGLIDPIAMVRLEALRAVRERGADWACIASLEAITDADLAVALVAIDQLSSCGRSMEAVFALERAVRDQSDLEVERGWHRNAHALLALAAAAPERLGDAIAVYASSRIWQVRLYAARAAIVVADRTRLELLAADADDRVANVARSAAGQPLRQPPAAATPALPPTAADLRRLASPRAIITIRNVGRVELALFTAEAPATVLRFAQLAESGYYNGLTFDRLAPNAVAQAGRRAADNSQYPKPEVGVWPHVRGAVGISTPDTGDAQFFINLVDNPRFDHEYTVFAQVLNGAELVELILEGDVIDAITIVP